MHIHNAHIAETHGIMYRVTLTGEIGELMVPGKRSTSVRGNEVALRAADFDD